MVCVSAEELFDIFGVEILLDEKKDLHKFALGKSVAKLRKLKSESRAKMVNATFSSLFTTPCFFGMQMRHLLSLPQIYILVFTFVRYICKEQI